MERLVQIFQVFTLIHQVFQTIHILGDQLRISMTLISGYGNIKAQVIKLIYYMEEQLYMVIEFISSEIGLPMKVRHISDFGYYRIA